ncbi:hypothetical protein AB8Z38_15995 [Bradyrhizobium sp. LLZ17]|uniref:Uncharacterized protein n=1 Tax=Bradyrhizobium sp. LLZ17 TaxID=3239388 RepID=A0AB39XV62_9BRAD
MKSLHCVLAVIALLSSPNARSEQANSATRGCVTGVGVARQQECDSAVSKQVGSGSNIILLSGGWQLVKTKDPSGGPDAVSIMHVADAKRSDIGLAGLSLQCGRQGIEILLIILERMSRGEPKVTLTSGNGRIAVFDASVVQAGQALLLPGNAAEFASRDWQQADELSVEIEGKSTSIRGTVPIGGLAGAYRLLTESCPVR